MTSSLISILEYVIRGIEHSFKDRKKEKNKEGRGKPRRKSEGMGKLDHRITSSFIGKNTRKNEVMNSLYHRLSTQLSYYPKSMDEYVEALYNVKKSLDRGVDIDTLRALTSSSITLDQLKNRILKKNYVDEYIKYLDMSIPESTMSLRGKRLGEYARRIDKELSEGNLNKKGFLRMYDKIAEVVERSLLQYENYDVEKILEKIALYSKDNREYIEKAQLLEAILSKYREEIEKRREEKIEHEKDLNENDEFFNFVYRNDKYKPIISFQKKILLYYSSLAKRYVHLVSIPKTSSTLPLELSETEKWKPWRDDISTLNIFDSVIRGAGRFIWGITTTKNVPLSFKSYYISRTSSYMIGVSIDVSGSTGWFSGNMSNIIEYEFVLALAVYYFAIKHNFPLILHLWSDKDVVFKIEHRITGFIDQLYREIKRIAGGGTEPSHLLKLMKEYLDAYWIILTDLEWPDDSSRKFLSFLRSRDQRGEINYFFINIYDPRDIYSKSPILYCKEDLQEQEPTCALYEYLLKHKRILTYDVIYDYDKMIKSILKKMKEIIYKNTRK
jgi:hypothetical protein